MLKLLCSPDTINTALHMHALLVKHVNGPTLPTTPCVTVCTTTLHTQCLSIKVPLQTLNMNRLEAEASTL